MTQSSIVPKDEVLNNTDILRLVFGLFEQSPAQFLSRATGVHDELSANGRKDLRNFALVCKAFNSPALDYLWKHLDNLTPLLKLHPALQVVDGSYVRVPLPLTASNRSNRRVTRHASLLVLPSRLYRQGYKERGGEVPCLFYQGQICCSLAWRQGSNPSDLTHWNGVARKAMSRYTAASRPREYHV